MSSLAVVVLAAVGWSARGGNQFADGNNAEPFEALALVVEPRLSDATYLRIEPELSLGRRLRFNDSRLVTRTSVRGYYGFDASDLVTLRGGIYMGLAFARGTEVPLGAALAGALRLGRDRRSEVGLFLDLGVADFGGNDAGGFGAATGLSFSYVWR